MLNGKTKSGFVFEIDEAVADDYELLELAATVDEQPLLVPKFIEKILGLDQKKKLMEHLRDENGRVSSLKVSEEIAEIVRADKEKN